MNVILVGAGGAGTSFAIATRLRVHWGHHVKLIITDTFDEHFVTTSFLADKFISVPPATDPKFKQVIGNIIKNEGVQTYIPIFNNELIIASELMSEYEFLHVDFWSSDLYALLTDKIFTNNWLNQIGVYTPKIIDWRLEDSGNRPWFSKPRNGFGSKDASVTNKIELEKLSPVDLENLLVQELCEKPEVTVDSFFNSSTNECFSYCRKRIETKAVVA